MKWYTFLEPHISGGVSKVLINEAGVLRYMRNVVAAQPNPKLVSEADLIAEFIAVHWADAVPENESPMDVGPGESRALAEVARLREVINQAAMAISAATQWGFDGQASTLVSWVESLAETYRVLDLRFIVKDGEGNEMPGPLAMRAGFAMGQILRLRDAIQAEIAIIQEQGGIGSHWEGCESDHPECARVKRLREALG